MTAPRAVNIGPPTTITPVRAGAAPSSLTAVTVGGAGGFAGPVALDDLTDVDGAALAPAGSVLVKESDGVYRAQLGGTGSTEQVDWFTGEGPPPPVIPGAGPGDMYIDTSTGWLYRLQ